MYLRQSHQAFSQNSGWKAVFLRKEAQTNSKVQIQETDEARKKFSNAKSISSAQFFGDQNKADADAQIEIMDQFLVPTRSFFTRPGIPPPPPANIYPYLGKELWFLDDGSSAISSADLLVKAMITPLILLRAQQDISSLKNIAGETGKKLSSFASTFITDLQDRIL
ncbi:hypothetical protein NC652_001535 [Populus alba x Populus x berolinensis]|nr:hypothetical protein NC652_001535 [Populus alba x Populus x berolinensis]